MGRRVVIDLWSPLNIFVALLPNLVLLSAPQTEDAFEFLSHHFRLLFEKLLSFRPPASPKFSDKLLHL